MKKYIVILSYCLLMAVTVSAQEQKKFSPEQFDAELKAFITREAAFTQQEADKYFALYKEMRQKQRAIYDSQRSANKEKPADEASAAAAVKQCDKQNIELKQIEQKYHEKMLSAVPATKVYEAIRAENRFHRRMMKGWQKMQGAMKGHPSKDKMAKDKQRDRHR